MVRTYIPFPNSLCANIRIPHSLRASHNLLWVRSRTSFQWKYRNIQLKLLRSFQEMNLKLVHIRLLEQKAVPYCLKLKFTW